jgi:hypothetical protein
MTVNIDKFLTPTEHAAEDHAGLDGVGNLSVSGTPTGTTDHSALDHAGIPGIPVPVSTVLAPGITIPGDIETALANFDIVYLRQGNYGTLPAQITVPPDKKLICLTAGTDQGNNPSGAEMAQFTVNSNIVGFFLQDNCELRGIHINATFAGTQILINCSPGNGYRIVRDVVLDYNNVWMGAGVESQVAMGHFENIRVFAIPLANNQYAFRQTQPTSGMLQMNIFRGIKVSGNGAGANSGIGIRAFGPGIMEQCYVKWRGTGIETGNAGRIWTLRDCFVEEIQSGNGIDLLSAGGIENCYMNVVLNCIGGTGIRWPFAGAGNGGILGPNRSSGNALNYSIGPKYVNHFNV